MSNVQGTIVFVDCVGSEGGNVYFQLSGDRNKRAYFKPDDPSARTYLDMLLHSLAARIKLSADLAGTLPGDAANTFKLQRLYLFPPA